MGAGDGADERTHVPAVVDSCIPVIIHLDLVGVRNPHDCVGYVESSCQLIEMEKVGYHILLPNMVGGGCCCSVWFGVGLAL